MAKNYDGWSVKNKWGFLLLWTAGELKRDVKRKVPDWKEWEKKGHKIVKVKLVEVDNG